ncbi:MAG: helicase-related protein, partial [Bdellovibrionota bacterium]
NVSRVINFHLPKEMDNYLHRVGRTARAGRSGLVVNLITERDQPLIDQLAGKSVKASKAAAKAAPRRNEGSGRDAGRTSQRKKPTTYKGERSKSGFKKPSRKR